MFRYFAEVIGTSIQERLNKGNTININTILNYVYAVMALVAVVTIIYNAIVYLTSQGDASVAKKATQGLLFSVIGLGIVMVAALLTNFIFTTIGGAQ